MKRETCYGRFFVARILSYCKVIGTPWNQASALCIRAGEQGERPLSRAAPRGRLAAPESRRTKSPTQSSLGFGRPASPTPLPLRSGNLPSREAPLRGGSPRRPRPAKPQICCPFCPRPGPRGVSTWAALWRPHAPQWRLSADPRDSLGPRRGLHVRIPRVGPWGRPPPRSAGANPASSRAGNPNARAAAKGAAGPGVAEEVERWHPAAGAQPSAGFSAPAPAPGQYPSAPEPNPSPCPKCPPESGAASRSPGCWIRVPGPSSHASSRSGGPGLGRLALPHDAPSSPPREAAVAETLSASGQASPTWTFA